MLTGSARAGGAQSSAAAADRGDLHVRALAGGDADARRLRRLHAVLQAARTDADSSSRPPLIVDGPPPPLAGAFVTIACGDSIRRAWRPERDGPPRPHCRLKTGNLPLGAQGPGGFSCVAPRRGGGCPPWANPSPGRRLYAARRRG
jgi:hypothetical protein